MDCLSADRLMAMSIGEGEADGGSLALPAILQLGQTV